MSKYIDADKFLAEIDALKYLCNLNTPYGIGAHDTLEKLRVFTISLQQEQPKDISVPKWLLENIEDTLRIQNNINNDKESGETCQDRNIRGCLNGVRKILNGEELTGMERLEPLKEQPSVDIEKMLAEGLGETWTKGPEETKRSICNFARYFYELGRNAR